MKKPKLLLLDSDVVLICHQLGVWKDLKTKYDIHVTSIVATIEVQYFKDSTGSYDIDLNAQAEIGEITIVEATASQMASITGNFVETFAQGLDDGETEGMAVLARGDLNDCAFCTGDTNSMQAVGMLGLGSQSLSLEEILEMCGLKTAVSGRIPPNFSKRNHEVQIRSGTQRRISGLYFKKPPLG